MGMGDYLQEDWELMKNQGRIKRHRSMTLQEIANQMGVDVRYIYDLEHSAMNKLKRNPRYQRVNQEYWTGGERISGNVGTC
jgi:DNA-directed RNA polymerase sigma subunit (sigma70/sigma32)